MKKTYSSSAYSNHDVLVIGGGAAGLSLALKIAEFTKVTILSKSSLHQGSTYYAQGGIAAVLDTQDSEISHVEDTLLAGAGLCHKDIVEYAVSRGPECIEWLMQQGVAFSQRDNPNKTGEISSNNFSIFSDFHLTQEGGHSHRRVIHSADATGKAIFKSLSEKVLANANITVLTNTVAIDLITSGKSDDKSDQCIGAYILDENTGAISTYNARFVVLATGEPAKRIYIPRTRMVLAATVLRWLGALVAV